MQQGLIEQFATFARPVLDLPVVRRTRRNHGLEHATIHILSQRIKDLRMAGRSTDSGFILLGDAPTDSIESAVNEALRRMRNGEHHLAVHPNCGTNLVTTGFLTTMAAMLGLTGASRRDVWNRMPAVMALTMAAILFSQPVGASLQRHITTDGNPADLEVISIRREQFHWPFSRNAVTMHRVITHSS